MLIGRERETEIIGRLKKRDFLAGGFLFFGEPQVGKFAFADELVRELEGNPSVPQERLIISPGESKIGIDEIRAMKSFLRRLPVMSKFRSVIISDSGLMTPEAQNAALKIVEEPPSYALIIFIARGIDSLLPTLVSRLRRIYFPPVGEKEISRWLMETRGISEKEASKLAGLSFGRPGLALELLENGKMSMTPPEIPKKFETPEEYERFMKTLLIWLYNKKKGDSTLMKKALSRMEASLKFNTNKKLQLQSIPWTR
jgi:DNA polymerase III subunit delta'